jgi:hypothetical protein
MSATCRFPEMDANAQEQLDLLRDKEILALIR